MNLLDVCGMALIGNKFEDQHMAIVIALLVGLLLQSPLQFEVASIKTNRSSLGGGNMDFPPTGRVNIVNATFKMMMQASYRLQDYQIIGGPNCVNTDRFDIQTRPPAQYKPEPAALIVKPASFQFMS